MLPSRPKDDTGSTSSSGSEDAISDDVVAHQPTGLNNFQKSFQDYIDEKPKTVADGVFKGLLSIGNGVVQGITGVVV